MIARVLHVDAFSARPGMGNPAGVVLDAKALSAAAMQDLARAVGFNETAFVQPSAKADVRLRYFTPGHKLPRPRRGRGQREGVVKVRGRGGSHPGSRLSSRAWIATSRSSTTHKE